MDFGISNALSTFALTAHWHANLMVFASLFGAMLLGFVVGYERSYHGRAAGMRTYGLVCMASAALTVISGYPEFWASGSAAGAHQVDPTRVIQGVITGVGFLCAGVIMKDGLNISGLTTSASLWAASAIGVMMGVGMHLNALLLTLLSLACMMGVSQLEGMLPARPAIALELRFVKNFIPDDAVLRLAASRWGYDIAMGSFSVQSQNGQIEWRFVAVAKGRHTGASLTTLSTELSDFEGIDNFHLSHARN